MSYFQREKLPNGPFKEHRPRINFLWFVQNKNDGMSDKCFKKLIGNSKSKFCSNTKNF